MPSCVKYTFLEEKKENCKESNWCWNPLHTVTGGVGGGGGCATLSCIDTVLVIRL